MLVMLLASVTVLANNTETAAPESGFTKDETELEDSKLSISKIEEKYSQIFFDENAESDKTIIDIKYERVCSVKYPLRHIFTGSIVDSEQGLSLDNPIVMMMYIKSGGKYIPLVDVDTDSHATVEPFFVSSKVDLINLGTNKENHVRIIVFRKNDAGKLIPDKNLQITNLKISVREWNIIEKAIFNISDFILTQP